MLETLGSFFDSRSLAPHGICLLWRPELVWTHVISDALIGAAYFSIPIALGYFIAKRRDLTFGWIFWCFAAFILACGTTHFFAIWTLWNPDYATEALIKLITAALSVTTAILLWPLLPRALAIPSPAQLQVANEQLQAHIFERDSALDALRREMSERGRAEEALRQSQKMESLGQITGGVAHDFNNLLAVVLANLEMLRKRLPDDPKLGRFVENALQGARRGANLTQRMLAFARRQELRPQTVDLIALMRGMSDLLQRSLGPIVEIEMRFPLELPCARVDANQLELAVLNLALNARDAMPKGGQIVISAQERKVAAEDAGGLAPGPYVVLSVTDTGEGMDEATLARVTEPFFTTKGVGKGTGLGLSMVHGLAAQSGGRLSIASRPGAGTTAKIWLPVATVANSDVDDPRPVNGGTEATTASKVLVVDDDDLVRRATVEMLEDLGYDVAEAGSGPAALALAGADPAIRLVVTDHAMPGMTGIQLARTLLASRPDLPIILATGYADVPERGETSLVRIDKPFTQQQLADRVAACLARRELREPASSETASGAP